MKQFFIGMLVGALLVYFGGSIFVNLLITDNQRLRSENAEIRQGIIEGNNDNGI